jgi:hypothetical protein
VRFSICAKARRVMPGFSSHQRWPTRGRSRHHGSADGQCCSLPMCQRVGVVLYDAARPSLDHRGLTNSLDCSTRIHAIASLAVSDAMIGQGDPQSAFSVCRGRRIATDPLSLQTFSRVAFLAVILTCAVMSLLSTRFLSWCVGLKRSRAVQKILLNSCRSPLSSLTTRSVIQTSHVSSVIVTKVRRERSFWPMV